MLVIHLVNCIQHLVVLISMKTPLMLQAINEQIEKMPDEYYHLDENVMWQVCTAHMRYISYA